MVNQWQIGKRYRYLLAGKDWTFLILSLNEEVAWARAYYKQEARYYTTFGRIEKQQLEIVPPEPRTGTGYIYEHKKDKSTYLSERAPLLNSAKMWNIFPITWTETISEESALKGDE